MSQERPCRAELPAGEVKYWCSCGLSGREPFCDGSHKGATDKRPVAFRCEQAGEVMLCMCKRTNTPPYCDGSHSRPGEP